jgi:Fic family protein
MLEQNNKDNEITGWLQYFSQTVLDAQGETQTQIDFLIAKARFFDKFQLNERQKKAVLRMFKEGPKGFKGGLSAENYITITGTSRATATRDLQDLVQKGAFTKTGEFKSTRYYLKVKVEE